VSLGGQVPLGQGRLESGRGIVIEKEGNDGLCLEGLTLLVDGQPLYEQSFSGTAAGCQWIDGDDGHQPSFAVSHATLRAHPLWRTYVPTYPVNGVTAEDIELRLESVFGWLVGADPGAEWGQPHAGEYVEVERVDRNTVRASVHLSPATVRDADPSIPDPQIELSFELHFEFIDALTITSEGRELEVTVRDLHVEPSFAWDPEVAGAASPCDYVARWISDPRAQDCSDLLVFWIRHAGFERWFEAFNWELEQGNTVCGDSSYPQVDVSAWSDVRFECRPEGSDAEVVWQRDDGQITYWTSVDDRASASYDVYSPVHWAWTPRALGDINGDGTDDLIFRRNDGQVHVWLMVAGERVHAYDIAGPIPASWTIEGVGDIDGDGTDDIIWRNEDDGRPHGWRMRDGGIASYGDLYGPVGSAWELVGVGDLDGDGTDDLLWQDNRGRVHGWAMSEWRRLYGYDIGVPVEGGARVATVGDMNGDGTDDVVFGYGDHLHYWPMHAGRPGSGVDLESSHMPFEPSWRLIGVGRVHD